MRKPDPKLVKAQLHEIDVRYGVEKRGRQKDRKFTMAPVRVAELERLLNHRYGQAELPADDAGLDDAKIVVHHLVQIGGKIAPGVRASAWLARRAPWMSRDEAEALIAAALAKPIRWGAETMGKRLRLTWTERNQLKITTIWAFDITREEAAAVQARTRRLARQAKRRLKGAKSRHEYEASAIGHGHPWVAEGVSKATWYRRQKLAVDHLQ
ncbi:hypothetical protein ACVWWO_009540 [Bradyrhizobium sp. F1.13.1]